MKSSLYDLSIRGACIFSLIGSVLYLLAMLGANSHCDNLLIGLTLLLQIAVLVPFTVIMVLFRVFAKNKPEPSATRQKLIYAALGAIALELLCSFFMAQIFGHTASCI